MKITAETITELFRQAAFISALIGAFSFTFVAVLLTAPRERKSTDWTIAFAALAAAGMIVCALGWTIAAPHATLLPSAAGNSELLSLPPWFKALHKSLSIVFVSSFYMFLCALGTSGWTRSKQLGIVTAMASGLAAIFSIWILIYCAR